MPGLQTRAALVVLTALACAMGWLALQGCCSYAWRALHDADEDVDWGRVGASVQGRRRGTLRAAAGGGGTWAHAQHLAALSAVQLARPLLPSHECLPNAGPPLAPL